MVKLITVLMVELMVQLMVSLMDDLTVKFMANGWLLYDKCVIDDGTHPTTNIVSHRMPPITTIMTMGNHFSQLQQVLMPN